MLDMGENWERLLPLVEFAYNNSFQSTIGMAPYEALYGRKCRSPVYWDEVGERKILGPEMIEETVGVVEKIREKIKIAQDRQKSYADKRRKDLEFSKGEKVFLKVAPMKGVIRFGKRGKLRPRYVGPFEILDRAERPGPLSAKTDEAVTPNRHTPKAIPRRSRRRVTGTG